MLLKIRQTDANNENKINSEFKVNPKKRWLHCSSIDYEINSNHCDYLRSISNFETHSPCVSVSSPMSDISDSTTGKIHKERDQDLIET